MALLWYASLLSPFTHPEFRRYLPFSLLTCCLFAFRAFIAASSPHEQHTALSNVPALPRPFITSLPPSAAGLTMDNRAMLPTTSSAGVATWVEQLDAAGQTYWWNTSTLESRWEKPDELKTDYEKVEVSRWHEYTDDKGRKYYHNEDTKDTIWQQPEEYRLYLERLETRRREAEEANSTPLERMLKTVYPDEPAKHHYAVLLAERHMTSSWTWDQAVSATFEDERSKVLKMAERKLVHQLMVSKLKTLESDERRLRDRKMVSEFNAMLETWSDLDRYSSYKDMSEKFANDHRLISVPNESHRIRLFGEFKANVERLEREKVSSELEKKVSIFQLFLSSCNLPSGLLWSEFLSQHANNPSLLALEPLERLKTFMDHMRAIQLEEDNTRSTERRKARSIVSKARDSYRSLLEEKANSGALDEIGTPPSWFKFQPKIYDDPRYQALVALSGSTPAELFYDFLSEADAQYAKDKRKVKNIVQNSGLRILLFSLQQALGAHRPTNLFETTLDSAPRLDFLAWSNKIRAQASHLDEATLRRIYQEFGSRELKKALGRLFRLRQALVSSLKREIEANPHVAHTPETAQNLLIAIDVNKILTDTERDLTIKEALAQVSTSADQLENSPQNEIVHQDGTHPFDGDDLESSSDEGEEEDRSQWQTSQAHSRDHSRMIP